MTTRLLAPLLSETSRESPATRPSEAKLSDVTP